MCAPHHSNLNVYDMCPRNFCDLVPHNHDTIDLSEVNEIYCQRVIGFVHKNTNDILCYSCYILLDTDEKVYFEHRTRHYLIIGESIGVGCFLCNYRLSNTLLYFYCLTCSYKFYNYSIYHDDDYVRDEDGNIIFTISDTVPEDVHEPCLIDVNVSSDEDKMSDVD